MLIIVVVTSVLATIINSSPDYMMLIKPSYNITNEKDYIQSLQHLDAARYFHIGVAVYQPNNCTYFKKYSEMFPNNYTQYQSTKKFLITEIKPECTISVVNHYAKHSGYSVLIAILDRVDNDFVSSEEHLDTILTIQSIKVDIYQRNWLFIGSESPYVITFAKNGIRAKEFVKDTFVLALIHKQLHFEVITKSVVFYCAFALLFAIIFIFEYTRWLIKRTKHRNETKKLLNSFTTKKYTILNNGHMTGEIGFETEFCPICLDEYSIDDILIIMPCKHEFHKFCILQWNKLICPLCKAEFDILLPQETVDNPSQAIGV